MSVLLALIAAALPAPTLTSMQARPDAPGMLAVTWVARNRTHRVTPRSRVVFTVLTESGERRAGYRPVPRLAPGQRFRSVAHVADPGEQWQVRACLRRCLTAGTIAAPVGPAPTPVATPTPIATPTPAPADSQAPKFAGIKTATTCIPGPIGGDRETTYHLSWDPGSDDVTPAEKLVYDVYQATKAGGEDLATPTYTSDPGATTLDSAPVRADTTVYFVVRARDEAGNRDVNTVELEGQNLCD